MTAKFLYLFLAIAGFALPYVFLLSFLAEYGLDWGEALGQLWGEDNLVRFFVADVLLTGVALLGYLVFRERRRLGRFWLLVAATLLVGPSCSLPLYLYLKQSDREVPAARERAAPAG